MVQENDAKGPFGAAGNSEPSGVPRLRIVTDMDLAVIDGCRVRENFLEALMFLKLLGHEVLFFSKFTEDDNFERSTRKYFLPNLLKGVGFKEDGPCSITVLGNDFFKINDKSDVESFCENEPFDIVFSIRPERLGIEKKSQAWINPESPVFHAFIEAILLDPNQDLKALVAKLKSSLPAPAPGQ